MSHTNLTHPRAIALSNCGRILLTCARVRRGRVQNGDRHRRSQYDRGTTAQIQDEAVGVFCRSPTKPYAIIQYRISVRLPEHDVGNTLCGHREMRACVDLVVSIPSLLMTSHTANAITASPITDLTTHGLNLSPPYWAVVVGTFRHQTGLRACEPLPEPTPPGTTASTIGVELRLPRRRRHMTRGQSQLIARLLTLAAVTSVGRLRQKGSHGTEISTSELHVQMPPGRTAEKDIRAIARATLLH